MKILIVLIAVAACVSALTTDQKAIAKGELKICAQENNVQAEEIAKIKGGDYSSVSQNVKCMTKCFFERVHFYENGELNEKVILEKLTLDADDEKKVSIKNAVEKCKGETGVDECDKAFNLFKCYAVARLVNVIGN